MSCETKGGSDCRQQKEVSTIKTVIKQEGELGIQKAKSARTFRVLRSKDEDRVERKNGLSLQLIISQFLPV